MCCSPQWDASENKPSNEESREAKRCRAREVEVRRESERARARMQQQGGQRRTNKKREKDIYMFYI